MSSTGKHDGDALHREAFSTAGPTPPAAEPARPDAEAGSVSDGHHTFDELYEHRHHLWALATRALPCWRAQLHADGDGYAGWFLVSATLPTGKEISYHVPNRLWSLFDHAETLQFGKPWDGHTAADVITRLAEALESREAARSREPGGDAEALSAALRRAALTAESHNAPGDAALCRAWAERAAALEASREAERAGGGVDMIAAERARQVSAEGYDAAHDDEHNHAELAVVAAELAVFETDASVDAGIVFDAPCDPWGLCEKHRDDRVRRLAIAGALIAAEIDRLNRAALSARRGEGGR